MLTSKRRRSKGAARAPKVPAKAVRHWRQTIRKAVAEGRCSTMEDLVRVLGEAR